MDKQTFSRYGSIVAVVLVLSLMIAFATPFGSFVVGGVKNLLFSFNSTAIDKLTNPDVDVTIGGGGSANLPAGGEVDPATGEILDSWEVIINNVNNGTYATKYAVGNYKPLDLGSEGVVNMQIAALDADILSDGSGNAHITWIAKELLTSIHTMNDTSTNADGWAASGMRAYLQNDVWSLIPANVQNAIVAVDKTYFDYTTSSTLTCSDKVWMPSFREVCGGTNFETSGVIYSGIFANSASLIKKLNSSVSTWWLRTAVIVDGSGFASIDGGGSAIYSYAHYSNGIALSFCF